MSTTSGFEVKHIVRALHGEELRRQSTTLAWIIGVIAIFISLFTLIILYIKVRKSHCPYLRNGVWSDNKPRPTPRSLLDTSKPKCDTLELQDQLRREEVKESSLKPSYWMKKILAGVNLHASCDMGRCNWMTNRAPPSKSRRFLSTSPVFAPVFSHRIPSDISQQLSTSSFSHYAHSTATALALCNQSLYNFTHK